MRLHENFLSAFQALRESWLRSTLTMLGIIIGVGSVVLLVALGLGVKKDVTRQIEKLGSNIAFILPGKLDSRGRPNALSTLGISTLTERDVQDLARVPGVVRAVPLMFVFGTVERKGETFPGLVIATTAEIFQVRLPPVASGRYFRAEDEGKMVCVLANEPKRLVFGEENPLGQKITVQGKSFEVVGTLKPEEESLFNDGSFENMIFLPYTAVKKAFHSGQINRIIIGLDYKKSPDAVLKAVKERLLLNHGGREDFGVLTPRQLLGLIYQVFNIVTSLLVGISAISLVVAGIGIMNIMLVTVTERTKEIGLRKAMGARQRDVFIQFLTEAVTLSFVGGTIGTLLASGICVMVARFSVLKPSITVGVIALAFGVCFLVGVTFGVAPAMRAACKDPIEALRHE